VAEKNGSKRVKERSIKSIELTRGYITIVDDEDYKELIKFKWHTCKRTDNLAYAVTTTYPNGNKKELRMHRVILGATKGQIVDHIDGDSLNNQRSNLRICSQMENMQNLHRVKGLSKYKGVGFHKAYGKWRARIQVNKKPIYLGYFKDEIDAAKAYDEAAKKHFGAFARLNFSDETVAGDTQTC